MIAWLLRRFRRPPAFEAGPALAAWFAAAQASGVPRGLVWAKYEPAGEPVFVRDVRRMLALVPAWVEFAPVPGKGFDDVPQATAPRRVVVLFECGRVWSTGRALFNVTAEGLLKANAGWVVG